MIDPITVSQVNKNTNAVTSTIETTIGESDSTDTSTVFGKLNQILSGGDTQAFKNLIQRTGTEFKPPEGIIRIGESCCKDYTNLTNVVLPSTINEIAEDAFLNCKSLVNINIPASVSNLGEYAFSNCYKMANIPNFNLTQITKIPLACFKGCAALKNIELSNSITFLDSSAFHGCTDLTWTTLPDSITEISGYAFANCSQLKLNTADWMNITNIGSYAFFNCTNIKISLITGDIDYIGTRAFQNTLTENGIIQFNTSNRLKIASYAFANISNVSAIHFVGEQPTSIATTAFSNCNMLTEIYVNWVENAVTGAPWGATNATVVYTVV